MSRNIQLRGAAIAGMCAFAVASTQAASMGATGTTEPGTQPADAVAGAVERAAGLDLVVNERGLISYAIAGAGFVDDQRGALKIGKPAGATTRKAYLAVATTGYSDKPLRTPVTLDGQAVALDMKTKSAISSFNYFTDVTDLVKPKLDAAVTGPVQFEIVEENTRRTDGEVLVVVYDDPAVTTEQSVAVMFGGSSIRTHGAVYELELAEPVQLDDPEAQLDMSLGISYSCLGAGCLLEQYSTIKINTKRLTTAAGGQDDGEPHDGALMTVGGDGDDIANPVRPFARPKSTSSDDELYDLRPFAATGDTAIRVRAKTGDDDNLFLATFALTPALVGAGRVH